MKAMGFSDQEEQILNTSEGPETGESESVDKSAAAAVEAEFTDSEIESSAEEQVAPESGESPDLAPAEAELSDSDLESSPQGQDELELEGQSAETPTEAEATDSELDATPETQEGPEPDESSEAETIEMELSEVELESEAEQIEEPGAVEADVAEEAIDLESEITGEISSPVLETESAAPKEDDSDLSLDFLDEDQEGLLEGEEDGRSWFVVHCYSGYENKVRHNLEQRIETMGMKDKIFDIVVPTEEEIEVREGKRRTVERRVFPGYILVNMIMTEESWYVVRNTPGVTGFVGMGNTPTPLRPEEVSQIIKRMEAEAPRIKVTFKAGERVRIVDGPFNDFRGTVSEIDMERAKVRVMVNFFGRETPVELDFLQVEKT
jgi:transcriptional antiterminator NusG